MKWTPQKTIARQVSALGGELAELVAVAAEVGEPDHLVLLIVVAEDQERVAQSPLDGEDPLVQLGVGQVAIGVETQGRGAHRGRERWPLWSSR